MLENLARKASPEPKKSFAPRSRLRSPPVWERVSIFAFGVLFVSALLVLAIAFPEPKQFQYTVFRSVLALACAAVAALIPGFLESQYRNLLRAGGALGVFVLVFLYNPAALVVAEQGKAAPSTVHIEQKTQQGDNFNDVNGNITITTPPPETKDKP